MPVWYRSTEIKVVFGFCTDFHSLSIDPVPGSMSQVREVANRSMQFSKRTTLTFAKVRHEARHRGPRTGAFGRYRDLF